MYPGLLLGNSELDQEAKVVYSRERSTSDSSMKEDITNREVFGYVFVLPVLFHLAEGVLA